MATIIELLTHAVDLATASVDDGGGPFGAVVVRRVGADDQWEQVAEGVNRVVALTDPTAHAEIVALRAAGATLGRFDLAGTVLVASCEPCPMCLAAGLWARVDAMLFAATREDAAQAGFDDLAFYDAFDTPRADWDVPVRQLSVEQAQAPFLAWSRHGQRVAY